MNERDFCYWLRGYFEILQHNRLHRGPSDASELSRTQVQCIKDHLELVFKKETPSTPGGGGGGLFRSPCLTCSVDEPPRVMSCSQGKPVMPVDRRTYADMMTQDGRWLHV